MAALGDDRRPLMTRLFLPLLALLLFGCVAHTGLSATDGAALGDGTADAKACASIKSALVARDSRVLSVLTIFCRDQLVVIAGALPPDYKLAVEAVHIATKTPGVRRVETVFVPKAAQETSDAAVAAKIRAALAEDATTQAPGTDLTVVAGTVVLVGLVKDQAKADRIIAGAASVEGVKSVRSFIQLRP
jgi:osmotically-inducible protein OsmY